MQIKLLPGDEGTPAGHHDVLLAVDVLLLERVDNVLLLEALEGEGERSVVGALDQFDAAEAADAQGGHHVQVGQSDLSVFGDELDGDAAVARPAAHRARAGREAARLVVVRLPAQFAQIANQLDERTWMIGGKISKKLINQSQIRHGRDEMIRLSVLIVGLV